MNEMALRWLKSIGKEQVQTFQDNFAASYNISMCLLSLDGEPLTVWSNESLLCYKLQKNNYERCISHRKKSIEAMLLKRKPIIDHCYTGLSYFLCPIFCHNEIIAFFIGGMVSVSEEKKEIFDAFFVRHIEKSELMNALNLLSSILSMINVTEEISCAEKKNNSLHIQLIKNFNLSERELSITDLLNERKSNSDIAETLFISEKTVKTHVSNILRKMNVKNRTEVLLICKELENRK